LNNPQLNSLPYCGNDHWKIIHRRANEAALLQGGLYSGRQEVKVFAFDVKPARSTLQYFMNFFQILISLLTL
jgi:hypothetical protein